MTSDCLVRKPRGQVRTWEVLGDSLASVQMGRFSEEPLIDVLCPRAKDENTLGKYSYH
jgi:hypothetical protein